MLYNFDGSTFFGGFASTGRQPEWNGLALGDLLHFFPRSASASLRARACVCVLFFSVSVNFGFNAAPSRRTVRNFNAWARNRGADVVVMDNPSSVITQVSRDEEASKAAAERGESLFLSHSRKNKKLWLSEWQPRKFASLSVVVATRTSWRFILHTRAQWRTFITLSCRGLTVAKIIMVAALWPVMKVAEVTSESQTLECSGNFGVEMF